MYSGQTYNIGIAVSTAILLSSAAIIAVFTELGCKCPFKPSPFLL
jgi:hypothetical protein